MSCGRTINRVDEETRARFSTRIKELADAGLTQEKAAEVLKGEFSNVHVTTRTLINFAHNNSIGAVFHKGVNPKAFVPNGEDAKAMQLEELMTRAGEFVRDYKPLSEVPAHIKATRLEDMGFDTVQEGVSLFSDLHYYSKITRASSNGLAEYNIDIARMRLTRWRDGILRFTQISQLVLKLDKLNILALGDDLEGHGEMFQSQALQMSESVVFQIMGFVEDMTSILLSYLERYHTLSIVKVPGNHGRISARARGSYTPDNFETVAWELIAERVRHQTGGEWRTSENGNRHLEGGQVEFHLIYGAIGFVEIQGWLCAVRHGHGIKGLQATYTGAIDNKLRLNSVIGEPINYLFKGHLHEAQSAEHEIRGEIVQNGSFVGPSLLSIEMSRAATNLPSQEFMLFHPRRGKTEHRRIHLAEAEEVRRIEVIGRED